MKEPSNKLTCVTFLERAQVDYLDKLGKDCFFACGKNLPRTKILAELVSFLQTLNPDIATMDLKNSTLSKELLKLLQK